MKQLVGHPPKVCTVHGAHVVIHHIIMTDIYLYSELNTTIPKRKTMYVANSISILFIIVAAYLMHDIFSQKSEGLSFCCIQGQCIITSNPQVHVCSILEYSNHFTCQGILSRVLPRDMYSRFLFLCLINPTIK